MMSEVFIPQKPLETAVLFLIFSRLETTKQVFEAIRKAKPPRLYIAADGARAERENENEKVKIVRDYVLDNIDWVCDVKTLFREKNLGCKYAVSGAISWFFENEDAGIILEDDCLPSQSFFWYCEELLNKYRFDDSVYLISGDSRGSESFDMKEDYSFCKYPLIWGWASWARVWKNYDPEITQWPMVRNDLIKRISTHRSTVVFWDKIFTKMYQKKIDTWDYQFSFLLLNNRGKCIVPRVNLIKNIGFGVDATHTFDHASSDANRECFELRIPLNHVTTKDSENKVNAYYDLNEFSFPSVFKRVRNKLKRLFLR